ncbi:serine hydrolase, partial [Bacteroidota bacterium]
NIDNFNSLNDLMNLIKDEPILFEPGTNSRYSNSGYATLGTVIESVTGKSFYNAVKELVLDPLELTDTYYPDFDLVRNDVVKYMRNIDGNIVRTPFRDWPSPAGGEYSTSSDLVKFIQGIFYTDKVLTDESKAIFLNRFDPERDNELDKIIQNERFIPMWAGGAPGVNGMICQFFKRNITITALSNYSPPAAMNIVEQIRQIIETGTYDAPRLPLEEKIYKVLKEEGTDYLENNFSSLTDGYRVRGTKDNILNNLGYNLLGMGKNDHAVDIFSVNTKLFPEVANTFDSLAEAYIIIGNKTKAIENYRKVLDLNPGNPNALQKLEEMGVDELEQK